MQHPEDDKQLSDAPPEHIDAATTASEAMIDAAPADAEESDELAAMVGEFLVESYENLDQLDRDLVILEQDPSSRDTLASIFRTIHTIKGTCGWFGYEKLESVTHVGENLLSRLRDGKLGLNPDMTSALLKLVDGVREMLNHIENERTEGNGDYSELIATLTRLQEGDTAAPAPKKVGDILVESAGVAAEEVAAAAKQQTEGDPRHLGEILVERGAVTEQTLVETLNFQGVNPEREGDPRHLGEILVAQGKITPQDVVEGLQTQGETRAGERSVSDSNIRVDVGQLDKLMNLVGELVLARNQILQYTATQEDVAFIATSQRLNLITTELQEGVMKTRMQPIGNIWSKMPRVVRDLSMTCGKRIRIEMEGKETELDKTIIEAIKDPLTHIVRNSVDHGIERPDVRASNGKPEEGRLLLRAFHEGGQVNIEITDDGAGINLERVKNKALERGLITGDQAAKMSDREATNLIFLPGFSTAAQVTNISGRGVGMDVVKTNIEKIGGTIEVQNRPGDGSTIKIKIPLTLAIIPALTVTSGGERFAIPQVSLLELVRLEGEEACARIEMIYGTPVYRLRGNILPLVYLNRELKLAPVASDQIAEDADSIKIVVLRANERQFGLVVDEINDTEEIVVKPLGKQLKGVTSFAGATIMGDGRVALILDVMGIAQQANLIAEARERTRSDEDKEARDGKDGQSLLLFAIGESGRMAIPLSMVARLEEFPATAVERTGNQEVVQYRGEIITLIRLSEVLHRPSAVDMTAPIQTVVYSHGQRSVGLVIDQILDIVDEGVQIQNTNAASAGVMGSAVIQQRVTELVNVRGIIESVDPSFFANSGAAAGVRI